MSFPGKHPGVGTRSELLSESLENHRQGRRVNCELKPDHRHCSAVGTDRKTKRRAGPQGKARYKLMSQANGLGNWCLCDCPLPGRGYC